MKKSFPASILISPRVRHIIVAVMIARLVACSALVTLQISPLLAEEPALRWIQLSNQQLEVNGLPWYRENGGELFRLPARLKDTFRKPVWDLAQSPSGGRIRFRTNSSVLAIRLEYPE